MRRATRRGGRLMERLCDLRGRRLVVACPPCGRRGTYDLARLRERFGAHADLYDVYRRLTRTCRRREAGRPQPDPSGGTCRATIEVEGGDGRAGLPSRT